MLKTNTIYGFLDIVRMISEVEEEEEHGLGSMLPLHFRTFKNGLGPNMIATRFYV